jgi:dTDP-4-amino-4,6-dideoxygalactose transaminase
MIPLTIPDVRDEDIQCAIDVLRSGMLVQGKMVQQFEELLAEYTGAKHAIAVTSGTAALHLALVSLGIGEGDAVLVPAFSFVASANAIQLTGATPVFVDIAPGDYNLDVALLEKAIQEHDGNSTLKAVMPVHEFGCPANMSAIMDVAARYNLVVVEDAACGLGARHAGQHVGTFGACGCFSFHPRKSITTGEGGVILTNDENLVEELRLLRSHGVVRGENGRIDCVKVGFNYRMTDFQAALGINQLKRFDQNLQDRRAIADAYYDALVTNERFSFPDRTEGHAWQSLMLMLNEGDLLELFGAARDAGIQLGQGAQCIPYTTAYGFKRGFPCADHCEQQGFVVPLYDGLSLEDVEQVVSFLKG